MKLRGLARLALTVIPVAAAAAPMALPQMARAATTIVVTTFADPALASTNCPAAANPCSLRAAVQLANEGSGDVIQLSAGTYDLTIPADTQLPDDGTTGDLDLQTDMTIQGTGATQTLIEGVGSPWNDRILEADNHSSAPTVTIQDLKVTAGDDTTQYGEGDGGAILNDDANLTLHNVIADNNASDNSGGGVASRTGSTETFNITNSTLSNNTAAGDGGGLWVGGSTTGVDSATNLYIHDNTANGRQVADSGGGGIYNDLSDGSGTGSISFSDIMALGNHAPFMGGGGVYDNSSLTTPAALPLRRPVAYQRITLSGNDAMLVGGGFYGAASDTTLTNATITNNTVTGSALAPAGNGGGISAGAAPLPGIITVNNATINGNSSPLAGGGAYAGQNGDQIHFHNTILVKNKAGAVSSECATANSAVIDSTGYNIVDDNTCAFVPATDRQGSSFNPNLGALLNNTGPLDGAPGATSPTLTEALPSGSIAIDTADPAGANNPATDERGVTRPQGPRSDVGAYEALFVTPVLPAAGHPAGDPAPPLWALLALAAATAVAAVGLGTRARS